ncbi:hypothetical protein MED01_001001 [Micromonospora sp. MED01]|uniref:hypothetical protein n=1 Tax=Micromonospora alfalfae TaxID=2911212 RepID=UPI001EE8E9D4|nr:hypothetical protein [Micromonospora alfalfae]MCG5462889.1 hypothetical protein [Micromonospora alfalfae]
MANINWDTVATSVAAAVFTTLAIEYTAKPWLEARKDRILEGMRGRRELLATIIKIALPAAFLTEHLPPSTPADMRQRLLEGRRQQYEVMRDQIQHLFENTGRYGGLYPGPVRDLVIRYILCIQGLAWSRRTQNDQARIVRALTAELALVLDGPRRHAPARLRAMRELDKLIRETETDDPADRHEALRT